MGPLRCKGARENSEQVFGARIYKGTEQLFSGAALTLN